MSPTPQPLLPNICATLEAFHHWLRRLRMSETLKMLKLKTLFFPKQIGVLDGFSAGGKWSLSEWRVKVYLDDCLTISFPCDWLYAPVHWFHRGLVTERLMRETVCVNQTNPLRPEHTMFPGLGGKGGSLFQRLTVSAAQSILIYHFSLC